MATPITVGATPIIAILKNKRRASVKFQNTGTTTLYFFRSPGVPTSSNYEFLLKPAGQNNSSGNSGNGNGNSGDNNNSAEMNEAFAETRSTAQFNVVSSAAGGQLAIFETKKYYNHG